MADRVTSPYVAGLSYFPDEYTDALDVGVPINWRGLTATSEGLGFPLVRTMREESVPSNWRGMMVSEGFGNVPPSNTAINDASGQDSSTLQNIVSFAKGIYQNWLQGAQRDQLRENRVALIQDFACAGAVLGAQIIIAGPANVASNEDPYWQAAATAVQSARPDVWAEAEQAGGWWPVGQPFDMIQPRQQMAAALSAVGITVNQAAITQAFSSSSPVPFQVTVAPGVAPPPTPGQPKPTTPPGTTPPPVAPGGGSTPVPSTPLTAGSTSTLALLALVGAVAYAMKKRA
jgi:hypothetical protein